ncbi:MAG: M36 family metallopeptidase [Chitinophagaceae bacterium]|nr:M36 family metallopeptidase [Chitinophagaceae bacterium]
MPAFLHRLLPHGVGFVWCTMLWEMTWEIINEIGTTTPNIYTWNGAGGNVRALRLVMEGLRTQPCSPGSVDARNNILLADTTLFGGIYSCAIWRAFLPKECLGFSTAVHLLPIRMTELPHSICI